MSTIRNLNDTEPYDSPYHKPRILVDRDGSGRILYVGYASPNAKKSDPVWQIEKYFYDSWGFIESAFADDDNTISKVWDDRATYSYTPDAG